MDVGKQFAEYLLRGKVAIANSTSQLTHLRPNKEDFISVMESWFDVLCSCNQVEGIKECAATATDVFAEWKRDISYSTAKQLATSQFCEDAIDFFKLALDCNDCEATEPSNYDIIEDMEQIFNRCIPRWHFRMINDISRNRSFFHAIKKAVTDGHSNVIDIGCGSGILSLFAATSGARNIMAFEVSPLMCDVAASVFSAYNSESHICLLNKMSTDHVTQSEHPRPDIAVMEIFDCGLFGEGVLPTLKHGLKHLMCVPSKESADSLKPKVIPKSARLFATLIECSEIRMHSRSRASVLNFHMNSLVLLGKMDPGDLSEQPYTTENLNFVKGGYYCLSEPIKILEVSFESIEELDKLSEQRFFVDIPVSHDGQLDAIVTWFELQVDDDIMLSSSPHTKSCWEQAVYHVHPDGCSTAISDINIIKGSSVQLQCYCNDHYLQILTHCIHAPSCKMLEGERASASDLDIKPHLPSSLPESLREKQNSLNTTNIGYLEQYNIPSTRDFSGSTSSVEVLSPISSSEVTTGNIESHHRNRANVESIQRSKLEGHLAVKGQASIHKSFTIAPESIASSNVSYAHKGSFEPENNRNGHRSCSCGSEDINCTTNGPLKKTVIPVNRRKVARINDEVYCGQYLKAISQTIAETLKWKDHLDVLLLCEGISLLPLLVTHKDIINIDVAVGNGDNLVFIEQVAAENRIDLKNYKFLRQSLPEVVCNGKKYDVIVNEVIEENGMLCQNLFSDLVLIRTFLLKRDGKLIPESLTMVGRVVESSTIEKDSFVRDPSVTLGFDIGKFLNHYQVSTQPDISMQTLPHKCLTNDFVLLPIALLEGSTDEEIVRLKLPRTAKLSLKIKENGNVSAVGYWFTIHLVDGVVLSTGADSKTHWNQSFVVLKQRTIVNEGSNLVLDIVLNRGNLHVVGCSVTDE